MIANKTLLFREKYGHKIPALNRKKENSKFKSIEQIIFNYITAKIIVGLRESENKNIWDAKTYIVNSAFFPEINDEKYSELYLKILHITGQDMALAAIVSAAISEMKKHDFVNHPSISKIANSDSSLVQEYKTDYDHFKKLSLFQHTCNAVDEAIRICSNQNPTTKNMVVVATLLHDFGKAETIRSMGTKYVAKSKKEKKSQYGKTNNHEENDSHQDYSDYFIRNIIGPKALEKTEKVLLPHNKHAEKIKEYLSNMIISIATIAGNHHSPVLLHGDKIKLVREADASARRKEIIQLKKGKK